MTVFRKLRLNAVFLGISALLMGSGAAAFDPITIVDQQSFAAGGKVETAPGTFEANRPTEASRQSFCAKAGKPALWTSRAAGMPAVPWQMPK